VPFTTVQKSASGLLADATPNDRPFKVVFPTWHVIGRQIGERVRINFGAILERPEGRLSGWFAGEPFTPLFEEEGDASRFALVAQVADQIRMHQTSAGAGFAADDYPVD